MPSSLFIAVYLFAYFVAILLSASPFNSFTVPSLFSRGLRSDVASHSKNSANHVTFHFAWRAFLIRIKHSFLFGAMKASWVALSIQRTVQVYTSQLPCSQIVLSLALLLHHQQVIAEEWRPEQLRQIANCVLIETVTWSVISIESAQLTADRRGARAIWSQTTSTRMIFIAFSFPSKKWWVCSLSLTLSLGQTVRGLGKTQHFMIQLATFVTQWSFN